MLSNSPSSPGTPAGGGWATADPISAADPAPVATFHRRTVGPPAAVLDRAAALDLDAHIHQPEEDPIEVVPDTTSDAALMDVAGLLQAMESADEWLGVLDGRFDALNAQLDALLGALGEEDEDEDDGEGSEGEEVEEEGVGDVGETVVAEVAKRVAAAKDADTTTTATVVAAAGPRKPMTHAAAGVEVAQAVVADEAK
ncbi:hypothetical protein AMAG_14160 [Allomyces macrogynus ATCC 38327]|uniref:Uncharacterized protein n=1 Tax=Allomyces macrogynus (strain ATCC 38327) TaxID=578462 RepID=A0A0L0T4F9_ALLM3|nr:hypothetical protein AMAG_14160 [Allomyces macrogynus ATCC 38327]|eukprot:KNE69605.1 hypothetical protein AMAG_14160 [Allomyces macrogynus ATCC 38327]